MLDRIGDANAVALVGLAGGLLLGLAARIGRFCTLGAIEDQLYAGDSRRLRMWALAIGTAVIGAALARAGGSFDPTETLYLSRVWSPLGSIIGGLLFGYGMAIAGNCGYGALARLGGGDLRGFIIVLVMGLSAYAVLSGPLAHARVWLFPVDDMAVAPQGFAESLGGATGLSPVVVALAIGGAILLLGLASREMLRSPGHVLWGIAVGLAVLSGWIGTWWVAHTGFDGERITTHSFSQPLGDTIFWLMTASGNTLSFSVGSVAGVLIGAFAGSLIKGHFRWEACEDPRELKRQMIGAALMGPGAVLAVGCSVGQGISAFSVLAWSAPLTFAAIYAGAALGLRQLISGFHTARG
ncbi:YeeE/YedE family protein [Vannielia litorea]|uniref:YeeE/YedE family protein n=1 Tax=Vannielia litorea TaxID=1217970 RepID=UPI001C97B7A6|nr:YeeE/YedE family protein [Vannielia litorea]MBY6154181.1 YeeE/YedE family protein [Vannielia litorea]